MRRSAPTWAHQHSKTGPSTPPANHNSGSAPEPKTPTCPGACTAACRLPRAQAPTALRSRIKPSSDPAAPLRVLITFALRAPESQFRYATNARFTSRACRRVSARSTRSSRGRSWPAVNGRGCTLQRRARFRSGTSATALTRYNVSHLSPPPHRFVRNKAYGQDSN